MRVCEHGWLAQTEDFAPANELFDADYACFSGFSSSWLAHPERYVADMGARFNLTADSHVVEVAASDSYLLQYVQARNIPCTGVEPTASTAAAARAKGIPIVEDFFGVRLAKERVAQGKQADLTAANNVLAHVPDINDFVAGFAVQLKPLGVATLEFPYLLTPAGVEEKPRITLAYLKRKEAEFEAIRREIEALKSELEFPKIGGGNW